ncbi:MAG: hypothetical protein ACETVW_06025 [Dehalococcoidia bacterium]
MGLIILAINVLFVVAIAGIGLRLGFRLLAMVFGQNQIRLWAKKEAKKMIDSGRVTDERKFNNVSRILATTKNDLEAAALWKLLQGIKER